MTEEETMSYADSNGDNIIDIITAYKSLKLAMSKNSKGLNVGREECQGKNYLKPTVASRHANRQKRIPGGPGLPPLSADPNANRRGQTAPTVGMLPGVMASRTNTRGMFASNKTNALNGMTLQDYAAGDAWCKSGFGGATSTTGQSRQTGTRSKPYWIQSR